MKNECTPNSDPGTSIKPPEEPPSLHATPHKERQQGISDRGTKRRRKQVLHVRDDDSEDECTEIVEGMFIEEQEEEEEEEEDTDNELIEVAPDLPFFFDSDCSDSEEKDPLKISPPPPPLQPTGSTKKKGRKQSLTVRKDPNVIPEEPKRCEFCSYECEFLSTLEEHQRSEHLELLRRRLKKQDFRFQCPLCGKVVRSRISVVKHYRNEHGIKNLTTKVCVVCGKGFEKDSHVVRHMKEEHPAWYHICRECGKNFAKKKEFNRHVYWEHPDSEYYHPKTKKICPLCDKPFKFETMLKRHLRNIHNTPC